MSLENFAEQCEHKKLTTECEECTAKDAGNLNCFNKVKKLADSYKGKEGKAQRANEPLSVNCNLELGTTNLKLKLIDNHEDPLVNASYQFFEKIFTNGELVSRETFARNIKGKTKHGKDRAKYRLFCVTDENNEVIAARVMEQLPVLGEDGKDTGENILYAIYIAVEDSQKYRGTGIAKQLYISSLLDSILEAKKLESGKGRKFNSVFAECSDATEGLQNSVGLKRIYFKNKDGKTYNEFNFKQPHMVFNPQTGKSTEEDENEEHFMMAHFDNSQINKEGLISAVRSLIRQYRSNLTEADFNTKGAFNEYEKYYEDFEKKLINEINQSGELKTMDISERTKYLGENGENSVTTHKPPKATQTTTD